MTKWTEQSSLLVPLKFEETRHDRLYTFAKYFLLLLIPAKMRFHVLCLRVVLWNSLNLFEIFRLSIAICFYRFFNSALAVDFTKNRKTIISLTVICHSMSVFPNVWKIEARRVPKCRKKIDLLTMPVWQVFISTQSTTTSPKYRETRKNIPR